jgi:hypothetical protein
MTGLNHTFEVSKQSLNLQDANSMYITAGERAWINSMFSHTTSGTGEDYPLLRDALIRFTKARMAPDVFVIEAMEELDQLADEDVLITPFAHIKEYEEALKKFHALPEQKFSVRRQVRDYILW